MADSRRYSPAVFAEFAIALSDGAVWLSIGQALLFGGGCLLFGVWLARIVGLLASDAPAGETLAVGLASGLLVLAAWWGAVASGGRSSFTPVAVGFAIALALAVVRRTRSPAAADVITRFDARRRMSWDIDKTFRERFGMDVCATRIAESVSLAESPFARLAFGFLP